MLVLLPLVNQAESAPSSGFGVEPKQDRLVITHSGQHVTDFVFQDPVILRPYFANIQAPGGVQVTRNHPPITGKDANDHDTMHPGLWLGFGDINGADFWRNKGRIEHVRFVEEPNVNAGRVNFATECRLQTADGKRIGMLENRFTLSASPAGWLLVWDAAFHSEDGDLAFGDQEEMGLGARVATPFIEKKGGEILSSRGQRMARVTWGQPAAWCDYSGVADGRRSGITLMADPSNFRECWWHNRDYGVFVANPFGRSAMKQGDKSTVLVKRGEKFRLRFGAMLHSTPMETKTDPSLFYRQFVDTGTDGAKP